MAAASVDLSKPTRVVLRLYHEDGHHYSSIKQAFFNSALPDDVSGTPYIDHTEPPQDNPRKTYILTLDLTPEALKQAKELQYHFFEGRKTEDGWTFKQMADNTKYSSKVKEFADQMYPWGCDKIADKTQMRSYPGSRYIDPAELGGLTPLQAGHRP